MPTLRNEQWKVMTDGTESGDLVTYEQVELMHKVTGVNLLATSVTSIIPVMASPSRFIPTRAIIQLTSVTGALTAAIVRIGNNANHDNVAPLFTLTGLTVVNNTLTIPLVSTVASIDMSATAISFEVQTAGGVATVAAADVYLFGIVV